MRRLALVAALWVSQAACAHSISPCLRTLTLADGKPGQESMGGFNLCPQFPERFKVAVHEHMTLAAISKYRASVKVDRTPNGWLYRYMTEREWSVAKGRVHLTRGIIFGNWWNDDPLKLTWGEDLDIVKGSSRAVLFLLDGQDKYPGSGDCDVRADRHLGRLSHFGKLQHLHFMTPLTEKESTAVQRVTQTTERALHWMKFAYRVARGEIDPEARFGKELRDDSGLEAVAENNCVQKEKNARVLTVFTLRDRTWTREYRRAMTRDVALGSMLHVMQDSFSPAHACRVERKGSDGMYAALVDVENYKEQRSSSHRDLDGYPSWLTQHIVSGKGKFKNDPVTVGAWLMKAVDEDTEWQDVETHLRNTIFVATGSGSNDAPCIGGKAKKI